MHDQTTDVAMSSRLRRWPWWALAGAVFAAASAGIGWAAATVMSPASAVLEQPAHTYVRVAEGEVGSSISLNTVASWTPTPVGANRAVGVVTSIGVATGDEVSDGSALYTVDLRPVVVAQGDVPAFRAIGPDVEGPDVAQVQAMLAARGLFSGSADGKAGVRTVASIKAWQRTVGVEATGVIEVGDVIFVPSLPMRVALDQDVLVRGATLSGGEAVLQGLPETPDFEVPVTDSQASMMPAGTRVEISSPTGGLWVGFAGEQRSDAQSGTVVVELAGEDGAVICGESCSEVAVVGQQLLASRIITAPTVTGLVVPSAALVTGADGRTAVIDDDGERISVSVIASARGMSVVEGVDEGTMVRVPAADAA